MTNFAKLNATVQAEIVQFTDEAGTNTNGKPNSTLIEFCQDLQNTSGFVAFLNDAKNFDIVSNGFLGYRATKNKSEDFIADMRQERKADFDATLWQTIDKWLKRSFVVVKRNRSFDDGNKFETQTKTDLADPNSLAFKGLEAFVTDLKDRTILYQVYFCIPEGKAPPCTKEGQYFVADFACVKAIKVNNTVTGYDVVIVDSKLSADSPFTDNQVTAKGMTGYYLRTEAKKLDGTIFKENPQIFKVGAFISRAKDATNTKMPFYKIISNGSLGYGSVVPKN